MARPAVGVTTDRLYARLPEFYRDYDAPLDYPLLRYIAAVVDQASDVEDLWRRFDAGELTDITAADASWLPWLGQLVGVDVAGEPNIDNQRALIADAPSGWQTGTEGAIRAVVRPYLSGTQVVDIVERDGDIYHVRVQVYRAQLDVMTYDALADQYGTYDAVAATFATYDDPDLKSLTTLQAALQAVKPAGLVLTLEVLTSAPYGKLPPSFATYNDLAAAFPTYDSMAGWVPPGG